VAFICAVDFFRYRIVGEFVNVVMAVSAGNISVCSICVNIFVNVITSFASLFVNASDLTILMAHKAVLFVCCICSGNDKGTYKKCCEE
jgi:hypothetical protein